MRTVAERLDEIRARMAEAARRAGRRADDAILIGVVKGQAAGRILEAYQEGLRDFAHSYVAEALKTEGLRREMPEARWHFIGPIQSNKTRHLQAGWHRIQSVDRLKVAKRLEASEVLVQVRLGAEESKSGVDPANLPRLLEALTGSSNVRVKGLMTIPPPPEQFPPERAFTELAELAAFCTDRGLLPARAELSMGMSDDFELAVEAGACWVRVGRRLFGER